MALIIQIMSSKAENSLFHFHFLNKDRGSEMHNVKRNGSETHLADGKPGEPSYWDKDAWDFSPGLYQWISL